MNFVTVALLFILAFYHIHSERYQTYYDYEKQYQWTPVCLNGTRQSPINIDISQVIMCPPNLHFSVTLVSTQAEFLVRRIENTKDLENPFQEQTTVKFIENGTQTDYFSWELHWHTPSEHTINGKHYDLELHIVHKNTAGTKIAVTGIMFYEVDNWQTTEFDQMDLAMDQNRNITFPWQIWDLKDKGIFHYKGSLTTPTCGQIVDWFVYMQPYKISKFQLDKIKAIKNNGKANSRNVQKLGNRIVYFLSPSGCPST